MGDENQRKQEKEERKVGGESGAREEKDAEKENQCVINNVENQEDI